MPPSSPSSRTAWLLALTAWASLLVMTAFVLVLGALTPGYSHVSQFISELGATGASHEWAARRLGFLPTGLALLAFCGLALKSLPRSVEGVLGLVGLAVYAAGYLVAVQFPCDPGCRPAQPSASQAIHNAAGGIGYLLAPAFLVLLARASRHWPGSTAALVKAGHAAAALAALGLLTLSPQSPVVGLSQRLVELAVLGWVAALGSCLLGAGRQARPASS